MRIPAPATPPRALLIAALAASAAATPLQRRSLSDLLTTLVDGVDIGQITQGILPDFWRWMPSADDVKRRLGISDEALLSAPLEVLNIPYAPPPPGVRAR